MNLKCFTIQGSPRYSYVFRPTPTLLAKEGEWGCGGEGARGRQGGRGGEVEGVARVGVVVRLG